MRGPRVSILTARGAGAVAVVRVWGPGARQVVDACFRPAGSRPLKATPGRPRFGRLGAGLGDEVVAFETPDGEAEVHAHGGLAAVELVVEALVAGGATRASADAWIRSRAGSRSRAEATIDASKAVTFRAASILLDQADGALDRELEAVRDALEVPGSASSLIGTLIGRSAMGVRLVSGWRVALAGRPNVGKSRLLNALAGFERSIVDPTPGTTRDVLGHATAFGGWPVELLDTAGIRPGVDPIEVEGVDRARVAHRGADLVVLVLDRSGPLWPVDRALLAQHPGALVVANKADLPGVWGMGDGPAGALVVSALSGEGVEGLAAEIGRRIVPEPIPPPGTGLPFRPRHVRRLEAIRAAIETGRVDRARRGLDRWLGDRTVGDRTSNRG